MLIYHQPSPVAFTMEAISVEMQYANQWNALRSCLFKIMVTALRSQCQRTDIILVFLFEWWALQAKREHIDRGGWGHYIDVIMGAIASQITSLTIVYSSVCLGADQRKHQSSASLAFVWGIHRWPVNSPHKWPVTRKILPFDDVIMQRWCSMLTSMTRSTQRFVCMWLAIKCHRKVDCNPLKR